MRPYEIHPELFVAAIPRGCVLGPSGVVITPDNGIVEESAWTGDGWLKQDRAVRALTLPKPEFLGGEYFTIASFSDEVYAHWMLDALPRLSLLPYTSTGPVKIIVSHLTQSWQRESLQTVGIDLSDVVILNRRYLQLEWLYLPSYVGQPGRIHPFAVRWLRKAFLQGNETMEPGNRLYLTRRSGRRRVRNEPELEPVLERFGFKIVDPGQLTLQQQVQLFSRAEAIAGPHGAGFTNLVFAPRECRIFELFAATCVRPMYSQLSTAIGQDYWYLVGQASLDPLHGDRGFDDMIINPADFERTLEHMLARR